MQRMKALALFAASAVVLAACSGGNNGASGSGGGANVTLTIAAVQGVEDITPNGPASYDEVLANAKAQNKSNFAGYIIRGKATNPVVADFLPILWSFGGDVFDENWNVVFDNAQSLAAVKFLVNDLKAVAQADPASSDAAERDKAMATGQGYQSSTWPGEINTAVLGPGTTVKDKVGFEPIPKGPS